MLMVEETPTVRFILTSKSLKEAKRKYCDKKSFYIVDIGKIIRDLGYDVNTLTIESEFVINYAVQKKITHGIYSTRCNDILVVYKNISEKFVDNLEYFLNEEVEEIFQFTIEVD
jgi:hypothetical protein